jgi:hypothetical protein
MATTTQDLPDVAPTAPAEETTPTTEPATESATDPNAKIQFEGEPPSTSPETVAPPTNGLSPKVEEPAKRRKSWFSFGKKKEEKEREEKKQREKEEKMKRRASRSEVYGMFKQ